ncbi:hypothetical protein SSPSH_001367 [Salinisphaera shabanensis E1L3A]|uniref:Uncharacterized protein n=1 Tax=Salinisphaera shabanensis E1L3A TaxID=1033802 RepID=U2FZU2_9GAMM|nr:hypothetical protein SSPSH_001367 [Salinisphaera shabanensis E1L3A]
MHSTVGRQSGQYQVRDSKRTQDQVEITGMKHITAGMLDDHLARGWRAAGKELPGIITAYERRLADAGRGIGTCTACGRRHDFRPFALARMNNAQTGIARAGDGGFYSFYNIDHPRRAEPLRLHLLAIDHQQRRPIAFDRAERRPLVGRRRYAQRRLCWRHHSNTTGANH